MLHITISSASQDTPVKLHHDLQMVKAALLYADEVKLCSVGTSSSLLQRSIPNFTIDEQIEYLLNNVSLVEESLDTRSAEALLREYKALRAKKQHTLDELMRVARLGSLHRSKWKKLSKLISNQTDVAGLNELGKAADSGLLEIQNLTDSGSPCKTTLHSLTAEFESSLQAIIGSNATYPLLDDVVGDLVRSEIGKGTMHLSPSSGKTARRSNLAFKLFDRLPLFEDASVAEILDIRRELERPLVRFRSAIIDYSDKIDVAPWDEEFSMAADDVIHKDIQPAMLEIEEAVNSNSYLKAFRKVIDKNLAVPAVSILGVGVSAVSALSTFALPSLMVSGAAAGIAIWNAYDEWDSQNKKTEQNKLYFYYRAGELLKERKYSYQK